MVSEVPPEGPEPPPIAQPPVQYAQYYRPQASPAYQGSADKLKALADGYFGLNWAFVANVVLAIGVNMGAAMTAPRGGTPYTGIYFLAFAAIGVLAALLSYPYNKKIGFAMGWSNVGPIVASALIGLNAWLCCGIIGYVVMQQIAASEMKRYGVRVGFTFTKRQVQSVIDQLRATEAQQAPPQ